MKFTARLFRNGDVRNAASTPHSFLALERAKRRSIVVLATILLLGVATPLASASPPAPSRHLIAPGTLLTNTALDGFSQVEQVDMLSPTLGYALAVHPLGHDHYWYYLVSTTNLATTWTVVSDLPLAHDSFPIYGDFNDTFNQPEIDFVSRNVGYVAEWGGPIYVTDNAGASWTKVATPGTSATYQTSDWTMDAVSEICPTKNSANDNAACSSELSQFALGLPRPTRSEEIPLSGARPNDDTVLLATAARSTAIVNRDADGPTTSTSLVLTNDGGASWRPLANPCAGLPIEQMVVAKDGEWLLSCFQDMGMSHGTAKIFRSWNDGATWSMVLYDLGTRNVVGNLGGTPVYLFFSGNDRILYGALMGPAGGSDQSVDGGRDWSSNRFLGSNGGSPVSISAFGPTSAIVQVFQGPMFVTRNASSWRVLPTLPAGPYKGLSVCTKSSVVASERTIRRGGLTYTDLDFTNDAATSCYLSGAPTIQPLGAGPTKVGPALSPELVDRSGDFVVLKGGGGVAHLLLAFVALTVRPSASCVAKKATALRITFDSSSHFRLKLGSHPLWTCKNVSNAIFVPLRKGRGNP